MSTDSVCGMEVYENIAPAMMLYEGETYYFCSKACRGLFENNPGAYLPGAA